MNMLQQPDTATAHTPETVLAHAPADHPKVTFGKIGILLANLGTPDHYSYWPMRRYLNEFLSDRRVIDYSPWIWQPLLQLVILTKRPFSSGHAYKSIWNEEKNESPLMTITRDQTAKMKERIEAQYGDKVVVDFCMRYGNPSTKSKVDELVAQGCRRSCSSRFTRNTPVRPPPRPATNSSARFRTSSGSPSRARWNPTTNIPSISRLWPSPSNAPMPGLKTVPTCWSPATTACRSAT
jgi:hypothetical protein